MPFPQVRAHVLWEKKEILRGVSRSCRETSKKRPWHTSVLDNNPTVLDKPDKSDDLVNARLKGALRN